MKTRMIGLLGAMAVLGCVNNPQDIPPGITEDPLFVAELQVGGGAVLLQAGVSDVILEVNHTATDRGVVRYSSVFKRKDCSGTGCGPSLEVHFWDGNVVDGPQSGVDATFQPSAKTYFNAFMDQEVEMMLTTGQSTAGSQYAYWSDPSGGVLSDQQTVSLISNPDSLVHLCHRTIGRDIQGQGVCLSSYCFEMRPAQPCVGWLKAERMVGGRVLVETQVIGEAPFSYQWMNGSTNPFILAPIQSAAATGVSVVITDANQSVVEIDQTLQLVNGKPALCPGNPGFTLDVGQAPFSQFNTVDLIFTDDAGSVFRTSGGAQPASSCEVLSVTDYINAPSGSPTKQLEIAFEATLYPDGGGDPIIFQASRVTVAVSYTE